MLMEGPSRFGRPANQRMDPVRIFKDSVADGSRLLSELRIVVRFVAAESWLR